MTVTTRPEKTDPTDIDINLAELPEDEASIRDVVRNDIA